MKRILTIVTCVFLLSCEKDEVQTQFEEAVVLKGILVGGDQLSSIELGTMQAIGDSSMEEPKSGASVFISGGGQSSVMGETVDMPGIYTSPASQLIVIPGHEYTVDVVIEGTELSASATIPNAIEIVSLSDPTLLIDENEPGQLVFEVSWQEEDGFEYVFVLDEPAEDQVQIDFSVPSGNFQSVHRLPTEKTVLRIYDTDLEYYGSHALHIYKIDLAYSELFRYSPGVNHNVFNGPDNVSGGAGYLAGVSRVTLDLEVVEL